METIQELWRGEISLPRTYWLWGSVIYGIGMIVGSLIISFLAEAMEFPFLITVWLSFTVLGGMFMSVAIWRSAGNYQGPRGWAIIARIIACTSLAAQVVDLFTGL